MRRAAQWLLACPIPDPELQLEVLSWAMALIALADLRDRWIH